MRRRRTQPEMHLVLDEILDGGANWMSIGITKIKYIVCSIITYATNNVCSCIIPQQERTPSNNRPRLCCDIAYIIICAKILHLVNGRFSEAVRRFKIFEKGSSASSYNIELNVLFTSPSEENCTKIRHPKV